MRIGSFEVPLDEVRQYCEHWLISDLALCGSVLREDFRPDSDVDVFIDYDDNGPFSFVELVRLEQLLKDVLRRDVDLTTRRGLHPLLRPEIEQSSIRVI